MPTVAKRSTTRRRLSDLKRRAGGAADGGERAMREAIGLLFAIYGSVLEKNHPGFITPSVDEFFTYIDTVGVEVREALAPVKKTNKFRAIGSMMPPAVSVSRRSRSKKRRVGGGMLKKMLELIIGPGNTLCQKVFQIIAVTLLGIMVASLLTVLPTYLAAEGATLDTAIGAAIADPAYVNSFADPLRWTCSRLLPSSLAYYDALFEGLNTFIKEGFGALRPEQLAGAAGMSLKGLGFVVSFICQKLVNSTLYHRLIVMPMSSLLLKAGMESCDEVYRSASSAAAGPAIIFVEAQIKKLVDAALVSDYEGIEEAFHLE